MAKLEFIQNNKDLRAHQYPKNSILRRWGMTASSIKRFDRVIIVDEYVRCDAPTMCIECIGDGYKIRDTDGQDHCIGWIDTEEGGWWELEAEITRV